MERSSCLASQTRNRKFRRHSLHEWIKKKEQRKKRRSRKKALAGDDQAGRGGELKFSAAKMAARLREGGTKKGEGDKRAKGLRGGGGGGSCCVGSALAGKRNQQSLGWGVGDGGKKAKVQEEGERGTFRGGTETKDRGPLFILVILCVGKKLTAKKWGSEGRPVMEKNRIGPIDLQNVTEKKKRFWPG